jgi:signal transduction histidine kinase
VRAAADSFLAGDTGGGGTRQLTSSQGRRVRVVPFTAASGLAALVASWRQPSAGKAAQEENDLMEDAAHSLRLALDREEAGLAHQETAALRRSGELQRDFLSRLSHELRTPLTAIRGYASSLMQPDVTWDRDSQDRFLDRIAAESARLGRLVDDLLDFSTIESGLMRLQPDWCDIPLVLQAAIACLPPADTAAVSVECAAELPVVWADHDRLEQVFVNLINNAVGHNPPGTRVLVTAESAAPSEISISVTDDGTGIPDDLAVAPFETGRRRRTRTGGAGLGLSIAHGIVQAHGGRIELERLARGSRFRVVLPVEAADHVTETGERRLTDVAALVPGGPAQGGNHRG